MSTSATLPNTIQMRPSRLTGLVVGVAILTGVATWSVSQVTTDSHAAGTPKSDVVSTSGAATKAHVDSVVALNPGQRAAMYGNVGLPTPYVGSVNALSPELQAVDISRTPYVGSLNALSPELQAVDISRTPTSGASTRSTPRREQGCSGRPTSPRSPTGPAPRD